MLSSFFKFLAFSLDASKSSYWKNAFEVCGLESEVENEEEVKTKFKRIDDYWTYVGNITGDDGKAKYPQLSALCRCVLSLSHGNAVPERGFSINKILLEAHGTSMDESTIQAHRFGRHLS